MAGLLTDVRSGLRALIANPAFVVLAALCLGIGIGASTMTFTVVNAALLEPLGSLEPEGLVDIYEVHQSSPQWWPASWPNFLDWQRSAAEHAQMSALRESSFVVGPSGSDVRIEGAYATNNLFEVLGVAPILGRGLLASDNAAGSEAVAVLSETLWRQRFGSDRAIIGRALSIDGSPHTVVGVVPALLDVGVPRVIRLARVWVPLRTDSPPLARDDRSLFVVARLSPDVSIESFSAQLDSLANELASIHREDAGWSVRVGPLASSIFGSARSMLQLSMAAAALVLLITCANVANLTLAHAMRRRHEFAIRASIGASPWRLARQLLSESVMVAMLGAVLGLVIARLGLDQLVRLYEADNLAPVALNIDTRALAFTIGVTVATTALFGLFPALEAARGATRAQIAESGAGTTMARAQGRLRRSLVVAQVAASLVLLIGATLLASSLIKLLNVDGGVATKRVTSIRIETLLDPSGPEDVARYVEPMLDALAAIPGVDSAASSNILPLRGGGYRTRVNVPGSDSATGPVIAYAGVTPRFFDALDIPILRGQGFRGNEQPGTAVINESLARNLWPSEDPVGRQFRLDAAPERGWITVIGISGDFLTWDSNGDRPLPTAYLDAESFDAFPVFFFLRKHEADQIISIEAISRAIDSTGVPIRRVVVTPMEQVARDPFWRQRLFSLWFAAFGIAALMLTAVGLYGVLGYLVWQRWREIGIRVALGARREKVLLMVLGQGARFVGAGIAIGLAGAYVLARAMRGLLFGVEALDWAVFVVVTIFLAAIAMFACLAPAFRAARIDPNALLRS